MQKIYLAGFDVFAPDAAERGKQMKDLCAAYGFEGCYPLDNEADTVQDIFAGNTGLIDGCDIVMANLNPFRGREPDSGTCFEVGYAWAKGKKIYGYLQDARTMREKFGVQDENGFSVENFHMAVNLMLGCAAEIVEGDLRACLQRAQQA